MAGYRVNFTVFKVKDKDIDKVKDKDKK